MLKWNANFQIPNSGHQSAWVFVKIENDWKTDGFLKVHHYADPECSHLLWEKEISSDGLSGTNPYDYLLSLEEYNQYTKK